MIGGSVFVLPGQLAGDECHCEPFAVSTAGMHIDGRQKEALSQP